jgi:hypothetical protein
MCWPSPTIAKAFNPQSIISGTTSVVTLTLTNSNAVDLNGGAFTDTLSKHERGGGPLAGLVWEPVRPPGGGPTSLSFSGITIPANSSCTVTFSVTSTTPGAQPNTTSGVTTTQTPTAGPASNTPSLIVYAVPTIAKAFNPASITSGGNFRGDPDAVQHEPEQPGGRELHGHAGQHERGGGAVTGTCVAPRRTLLAAGATSLSFTGITHSGERQLHGDLQRHQQHAGRPEQHDFGRHHHANPHGRRGSNTATLTVLASAHHRQGVQSGLDSHPAGLRW